MMIKRGGNTNVLLVIFFLTLLILPTVFAADVAYIMKNSRKVDQNVIGAFHDLGFTTELIKDTAVKTTDFSKYKIIFVGDERLRNAAKYLDVTNKKTIIMNYYYGEEFGLTDNDGLGNFVASEPLKVVKDNSVIPVYTEANVNGKYLPYYYIPKNNKIQGFVQVARPYAGDGENIGDVISYANEGDVLENGKIVKENLCFYGIARTAYWTPQAKNLFKDCVDFVAVECSSNNECDDNNNQTQDICTNPGMRDSNCVHNPIVCTRDLDCGTNGFTGNNMCSSKDVVRPYTNYTCLNPGTNISSCRNQTENRLIEQCAYQCANGACLPQPANVTCSTNSQCGTDGFIGNNFCTMNNVAKNFVSYMCNNPGMNNSYCSNNTDTRTVQQCTYQCANGACVNPGTNITCTSNSQCNDNNPLTYDQCVNPGTAASTCRNSPVNCASDVDCGITGFVGSEYCSANNVDKNYQNSTCINPGTLQSHCVVSVTQSLVQVCMNACSNGICVGCDMNSDCNDNNRSTVDTCKNPGTINSYCENKPNGNVTITCMSNSGCGTDGFVGNNFCTMNNVTRNFVSYMCNNPGTQQSYCTSSVQVKNTQQCAYQCANGACVNPPVNITCSSDSQCGDNNPLTYDQCIHPGTAASSCRNTEVNCASDVDCGITGFVGSEYCSANNVDKNYQTSQCHNPGRLDSYCTAQIEQRQVDACQFACSVGVCIRCDENLDCNDNSGNTDDICKNPGTINSYCENKPKPLMNVTTCGNNMSGTIAGYGVTFAPFSNTVDQSSTNTLSVKIKNLDGVGKTVTYQKYECRCNSHLGNPAGACLDYWPSMIYTGGDGWRNSSCQLVNETISLGPNEEKTTQVSVTQYQNKMCGLFQTDLALVNVNGNNVFQPMAWGVVDMCVDCTPNANAKIVNLVDMRASTDICNGVVNFTCITNDSTHSIDAIENFPTVNNRYAFINSRKVGNNWEYDYSFDVSKSLTGNYQVSCLLDNIRSDTDLAKVNPYPANYIITKVVNVSGCPHMGS